MAANTTKITKTMDLSKHPTAEMQSLVTRMTQDNSPVYSLSCKQINLSNNDVFEDVVSLLATNTHLRTLNLWGCQINNDLLRRLCWALTNPTSKSQLRQLNLG